jgi:hypothetical protein
MTALVVEFKRPVYERVVAHFNPLAEALRDGKPLPVTEAV